MTNATTVANYCHDMHSACCDIEMNLFNISTVNSLLEHAKEQT